MAQCAAISNPNSSWPAFCPKIGAAYAFAALFGLTTIAHIVQAIMYRKLYCLIIIVSAAMQTGNFIVRILSIQNVTNQTLYSDWFILMLVAPIWTNAYVYMVMGRMVYNYTPTAEVFKVKAWRLGTVFVLLDICAFIVQLSGLALLSAKHNPSNATLGIHIYMAGIGFQQFCIFLFLAVAIQFHRRLRLQECSIDRSKGLLLLYIEYIVVGLITVRIIFRLIEYSQGINSSIALHEVYEYIFDSTVMLIASTLFNVVHPGRLMPGKEANFPTRKMRKAMRREGQVPSGRGLGGYHLPKYQNTEEAEITEA